MLTQQPEAGFSLVDILVALAIVAIVTAMAVPMTATSLGAYRFRGDGQAVSNLLGVAKMRAAARFSRSRLYADLDAGTYALQTWDKTAAAWLPDGPSGVLSPGVTFGFGALATPPPNTQATIAMSPACTDDDGAAIDETACIVFNSRGIPIDAAGAPTGGNALYLSNGTGVYAVTVTSTPLIRFWWSPPQTAAWVEQQ